jgi:hypothetical protein
MAGEQDHPKTKRVYRRPKLTVYGDVRDLTQSTLNAGPATDMVTGMNKSK